jgi:ABC-type uncharacterized transport system ATPase component
VGEVHGRLARALVKKVVEDSQIPTLLVTHDIRDLKALNAARITKIQNGKLVEGY